MTLIRMLAARESWEQASFMREYQRLKAQTYHRDIQNSRWRCTRCLTEWRWSKTRPRGMTPEVRRLVNEGELCPYCSQLGTTQPVTEILRVAVEMPRASFGDNFGDYVQDMGPMWDPDKPLREQLVTASWEAYGISKCLVGKWPLAPKPDKNGRTRTVRRTVTRYTPGEAPVATQVQDDVISSRNMLAWIGGPLDEYLRRLDDKTLELSYQTMEKLWTAQPDPQQDWKDGGHQTWLLLTKSEIERRKL
jgi:hypothetical protein